MSAPKRRTINVRLINGPLHGVVMDLPPGTESYPVGDPKKCKPFFLYEYAGKSGDVTLFATAPKSRAGRRFIRHVVETTGQHPAAIRDDHKLVPFRYAEGERPVKHGRGARKRAERRANAVVG